RRAELNENTEDVSVEEPYNPPQWRYWSYSALFWWLPLLFLRLSGRLETVRRRGLDPLEVGVAAFFSARACRTFLPREACRQTDRQTCPKVCRHLHLLF
ncbi:hypothetical protein MHYP_G00270170, partial [Metynnis hypsauchen]